MKNLTIETVNFQIEIGIPPGKLIQFLEKLMNTPSWACGVYLWFVLYKVKYYIIMTNITF